MLALPNDDVAGEAVGSSLLLASWTGIGPSKELFAALAGRWLAVGKPVLARYTALLGEAADKEPAFQSFFEGVPQLLDPMAMQVWSKPDLHGAKEPDFVIRRIDDSYLIVEIETPAKQLVTEANQISAKVTQAVSQVMEYRTFLAERHQDALKVFPRFQNPDCLVVLGLESTLDENQKRALLIENQHRHGIRIVGFDWIAARAEAVCENIISTRLTADTARMI